MTGTYWTCKIMLILSISLHTYVYIYLPVYCGHLSRKIKEFKVKHSNQTKKIKFAMAMAKRGCL